MPTVYTCECQDGRTITGTAKWSPEELRQMNPIQLADVMRELMSFAEYYTSNFFLPIQKLESERTQLQKQNSTARTWALIVGSATGFITILWVLLVLIPFLRFSGLTLTMAVLTFVSIICFIPILFWFVSAHDNYTKRYPRVCAKLDRIIQKQEQELFGTYVDFLISGHIVSPEYCLSAQAMEFMFRALSTKKASSAAEAILLCKNEIGPSPVPKIVLSLHSVSAPAGQQKTKNENIYKKTDLTQMENQGPDLRTVLQLSDYLHAAIRSYAADQKAPSDQPDSIAATLSLEEEALVAEYRTLNADEKKRIRRVIHSFYKKQY